MGQHNCWLEQQKRLSVRDLASKFEKGLAAAAKLSEEVKWFQSFLHFARKLVCFLSEVWYVVCFNLLLVFSLTFWRLILREILEIFGACYVLRKYTGNRIIFHIMRSCKKVLFSFLFCFV